MADRPTGSHQQMEPKMENRPRPSGPNSNEKAAANENGLKTRGLQPGILLAPIMYKFPDLSDFESGSDLSNSDTDDSSECEENEWGFPSWPDSDDSILTRTPGSSMDEDEDNEEDEDGWVTEEEEVVPSNEEDLKPPVTKPENNAEPVNAESDQTLDQLKPENDGELKSTESKPANDQSGKTLDRSPKALCTGFDTDLTEAKRQELMMLFAPMLRKKPEVIPIVDERIGDILASSPVIAEHILANLPFSTLRTCAQVCQLWNTVVKNIKRQRHGIFWMFMLRGVSFWDKHINRRKFPWQDHFLASTSSDIGDHFYEKLRDACSEPKLGIMFCSNSVAAKPLQYFYDYPETCPYTCCQRKGKLRTSEETCKRLLVDEFLSKKLPSTCSLIGCAGRGLIGTPVDASKPIRVESSMGLSAVFFPSIPGMEIFQFSITEKEAKKVELDVDMAKCFMGADTASKVTGIPQGKKLKFFLMFVQEMDIFRHCQNLQFVSAIMRFYMDQQDDKLAFAAGISESIMCPLKPGDETWHFATGVAFAGDNVYAASVVLERDIRTRVEIIRKLAELKACNIPQNNLMGLMITSKDRNKNLKGKTNFEADLFGQMFPKVPLFGIPVDGEVGINYLPKENEDSDLDKTLSWLTGCTTIIVLLSWTKKVK